MLCILDYNSITLVKGAYMKWRFIWWPAYENLTGIVEVINNPSVRPRDTLSPPPQALRRSRWIRRAGPPHQLPPLCTSTAYDFRKQTQICQNIPGNVYIVFHRLHRKQWTNLEVTNGLTNNLRDFQFWLPACRKEMTVGSVDNRCSPGQHDIFCLLK